MLILHSWVGHKSEVKLSDNSVACYELGLHSTIWLKERERESSQSTENSAFHLAFFAQPYCFNKQPPLKKIVATPKIAKGFIQPRIPVSKLFCGDTILGLEFLAVFSGIRRSIAEAI